MSNRKTGEIISLDEEFDECPVCLHQLNSCYCETTRKEFQYDEDESKDKYLAA